MLLEPLLPLYPQDAEALLQVNVLGENSGSGPSATMASATPSSPNLSSPQAGLRTQSAQLSPKQCAVLVSQHNSFGLFCLYDEGSVPTSGDPEDQSRANLLPTHKQEPVSNNQGAQKSKQSFKSLVDIVTSANFRSEDLYCTSWAAIDRQLGSLGMVYDHSQATPAAADSEEWQAKDDGWMQWDITISIPFPRRSLHPGPKTYTVSRFYRRSLVSIICEAL